MKFVHRTFLAGVLMILVILYFYYIFLGVPEEVQRLSYISDKFGEDCVYKGVVYEEGELFSEPCKDCYCSFGTVECAVVHCKETINNLGMDLIKRSVQVLIPTNSDHFAGTIAVMNSVLKHTKHSIKFSIVLYQNDDDPILSVNHLRNWIDGTMRFADYVILSPSDKSKEWIGHDSSIVTEYKLAKINQSAEKLKIAMKRIMSSTGTALLMLNTLLPREHRVVVLNNRVLIKGDIADLFNIDLKDNPVAVIGSCQDALPSQSLHFRDYFKGDLLLQYGVPKEGCTFSPGVVVADLNKWFSDEIEMRLSFILWNVILKEEDLLSSEQEKVCFAPLLLNFWNRFLDLKSVWSVCNLNGKEVPSPAVLEEAKVLDWGYDRPWKTQADNSFNVWKEYFLNDPTGMFRLNYPTHQSL